MMDMDNDQELKDKLLQSLIEKMEDILGDDMKPADKGMSVEVAAPDKAHLAQGLDKAKDVLQHAPMPEAMATGKDEPASDEEDGRSDAERLAELLGDDDEGEDEKEDKRA